MHPLTVTVLALVIVGMVALYLAADPTPRPKGSASWFDIPQPTNRAARRGQAPAQREPVVLRVPSGPTFRAVSGRVGSRRRG
jgi:hypothetical protein